MKNCTCTDDCVSCLEHNNDTNLVKDPEPASLVVSGNLCLQARDSARRMRSPYWTGGRSGTSDKDRGRGKGRGFSRPPLPASPSLCHSSQLLHSIVQYGDRIYRASNLSILALENKITNPLLTSLVTYSLPATKLWRLPFSLIIYRTLEVICQLKRFKS